MSMKFYVYIYLDPRKPGHYCYNNVSFLYEPFYIGKGKGKRHLDHLRYLQREQNIHFKKRLRKILILSDIEKYIVILNNNLSEPKAFEFETYLIKDIGRFDLGLGPLTNHTDGGEGFSGRKEHPRGMLNKHHSTEAKQKIRLAHLGEKNAMFRTHLSQEILEKMRIHRTGKNNPMFGKPVSKETTDISQQYNVQAQTIRSIKKGRTWKQVHKFFVGGDSIE